MNMMKEWLKNIVQSLVPGNFLVYHGSRRRKEIALTFDDGPNPAFTAKVLDLLKELDIKASFFLVGSEIKKNAVLARRIKEEGHGVCNHTYSHRTVRDLSLNMWLDEIRQTNGQLATLGHNGVVLVRPPHGTLTTPFVYAALRTSSKIALWSIDSLDWQRAGSDKILKAVFARPLLNGDIILMHDDNESTLTALPELISRAIGDGFSFVTLEHLWGKF